MADWIPRRILRELADETLRQEMFLTFWKTADRDEKHLAYQAVADALNCRMSYAKGLPVEEKARHLAECAGSDKHAEVMGTVLVRHHFQERAGLMSAFLDFWKIPHKDCSVPADCPQAPDVETALKSVLALEDSYSLRDVAVYLATAGWATAAWKKPLWTVVELIAESGRLGLAGTGEGALDPANPLAFPDDAFSDLDKLLISAAVQSVSEVEGAPPLGEMEKIVAETIRLNPARTKSYFHRGFFHGLSGRAFTGDFREANPSRRGWLLAGEICALARRRDLDVLVKIFEKRWDVYKELRDLEEACAVIGCKEVFDALWESRRFADAIESISTPLAMRLGGALLEKLHGTGVELLRQRNSVEAKAIFRFVEQVLCAVEVAGGKIAPDLRMEQWRRLAICERVDRNFAESRGILEKAREQFGAEFTPDMWADLGLTAGDFAWLLDLRVPKRIGDVPGRIAQIEAGKEMFEKAVRMPDRPAPNANYALGVLGLLQGDYPAARKHLERAYQFASEQSRRYREARLYSRIQAYYAFSIFLDDDEARFRAGVDLLRRSAEDLPSGEWPGWLIEKALPTIEYGYAGSLELLEWVHERFPKLLGELARNVDLLEKSRTLREFLLHRARSEERGAEERWDDELALFEYHRRIGDLDDAAASLDALERMTRECTRFWKKFNDFLSKPENVDPVWYEEDVDYALAGVLEQHGQYEVAASHLIKRFHQSIAARDLGAADGLIERLESYGVPIDGIPVLRGILEAREAEARERVPSADEAAAKLANLRVRILFIGGDERQAGHDKRILEHFREKLPKVRIEFMHTGWTSQWGRQLDEIKRRAEENHLAVLMPFMRTNLGRSVRRHLGSVKKPWRACTGKSAIAMIRSLERAIEWYAFERSRSAEPAG